jgi:hypothetical protein
MSQWNERTISADIQSFANYNTCYAVWLAKVDALCGRLLNVELLQLLESESIDPLEDFEQGVHPDKFFADVLVTVIEQEQGADFIEEVIGIEAMWGISTP